MKPMIIGQAPSRTSDPGEPLSGNSGRRLADLCGIEFAVFLETFERKNLVDSYPGAAAKGDLVVDRVSARELAGRFRPMVTGRRVVILGLSTAAAFELTHRAFLFAPHWNGQFAFSPHPSGVNLWWNDAENEKRARAFFSELAREARQP